MFQRHYSDETLLACLDGELSQSKARAVRVHLKVCWECRAKLAELESQAEAVSRLLLEQLPSDINRSMRGLERFLRWQERAETQRAPVPRFPTVYSVGVKRRRRLGVAAAVGLVCVVGLSIWLLSCQSATFSSDV